MFRKLAYSRNLNELHIHQQGFIMASLIFLWNIQILIQCMCHTKIMRIICTNQEQWNYAHTPL